MGRDCHRVYILRVGQHFNVPLDADGMFWVYYRDIADDEYISAHKILDPKYRKEVEPYVVGRIVFVGTSAEGLRDIRSTPLGVFVPGVEVHVNVVEQIIQGKFLRRPALIKSAEALAILGAGLLIVILAQFVGTVLVALISTGIIFCAFYVSWIFYTKQGLLFDPVYLSLSVIAIFFVSALLTYMRSEVERKQVRSAFGHYISPDFMKELSKDPDKLKLGGELKDLTVMFTDIRSFTTISEGLEPEELIQLMNDFLTPMSDLVMQNRGTIDKYMGDAMMAFWNAPLDDDEHARNACKAALGMQAALVPINESVKMKAKEMGKEPVLLNAGIGINTGPCAVGNMGSRQRFAYSTLGDAVNLASRLEGQTKAYGVNILIGEETYKQVSDFAVIEADLIKVKGKTKPVRMYILLGDDVYASSEAFGKLRAEQEKMLGHYRSQRFKEAIKGAKACKSLGDERLDAFFDVYIERAEEFLKTPPGDDWDGVYEAKAKKA